MVSLLSWNGSGLLGITEDHQQVTQRELYRENCTASVNVNLLHRLIHPM